MNDPSELSISELRSKRGERAAPLSTDSPAPPPGSRPSPEQAASSARPAAGPTPAYERLPSVPTVEPAATYATPPAWRPPAVSPPAPWKVDPWRFLAALRRRWFLITVATLAGGLGGGALGTWQWKSSYEATVRLIRRQSLTPSAGMSTNQVPARYKAQELPETTVRMLLESPELARRVCRQSAPPVSEQDFRVSLEFGADGQAEVMRVRLRTPLSAEAAADLANLYASNIVSFTEEILERDAREIAGYLAQQLSAVDRDLTAANQELQRFSAETQIVDVDKETEAYVRQLSEVEFNYEKARIDFETLDLRYVPPPPGQRQDPLVEQLSAARLELDNLLGRYTENHPLVKDQLAKVQRLEQAIQEKRGTGAAAEAALDPARAELNAQKQYFRKQMEEYDALRKNLRARLSGLSAQGLTYARLKARVRQLQDMHSLLATRQREATLYVDDTFGYYTVLAPATLQNVRAVSRWPYVGAAAGGGALLGLLVTVGLVLLAERLDVHLKTRDDVEQATGLPVIATLGDLKRMSADERNAWAYQTWAQLTNTLPSPASTEFVCGFIASRPGEGCSTWIRLLAQAAHEHGHRVLVVRLPDVRTAKPAATTAAARKKDKKAAAQAPSPAPEFPDAGAVVQRLLSPEPPPVTEVELPAWLWNRERRAKLQTALAQWRSLYNVALLIELPPASTGEAVLLAQLVPQVLWLVGGGTARRTETRRLLQIMRQARCNLVGAVLNRETVTPLKDRLG